MLRNLPTDLNRDMLKRLLDREGFESLYNFIYMPLCLSTMNSFGYAFVNLVSFIVADQCWSKFQGFSDWEMPCSKVSEVAWSNVEQGLENNIENYRNSSIMHQDVPELCKPAIFMNGCPTPFPPPTKALDRPDAKEWYSRHYGGSKTDSNDGAKPQKGKRQVR